MTLQSGIYLGAVVNKRVRPRTHKLNYRVFSFLLDLDELAGMDRRIRFFGHNRWAPFAFHDRDHGPMTGEPLRPWAEAMRDAWRFGSARASPRACLRGDQTSRPR